jgi:hypothetical protein
MSPSSAATLTAPRTAPLTRPVPRCEPPLRDGFGSKYPTQPIVHNKISALYSGGPIQDTLALNFPEVSEPDFFPVEALVRPEKPSATTRHCLRIVRAAMEVAEGHRSVSQLTRWTSTEVRELLLRQSHRARQSTASRQRTSGGIQTFRICDVEPKVTEIAIVVRRGPRYGAIATRFELGERHWICTAFITR